MVSPEKVINGTFGEVWIDDEYMAEVTSFQATVELDKQEVQQCGTLAKGHKITGTSGKGTLKFNKVTSFFIKKLSADMKEGKTTPCTIISNLNDPDSDGNEKVKLSGCVFDKLILGDWEARKLAEETYDFTFTDWEIMDMI